MQLTRDTGSPNLIRAWESGRVRIGDRWIQGNVLVAADRIEPWSVGAPQAIALADLDAAIAQNPEIVLLGTGANLSLPDLALIAALADQGIGLEIMSTPAACRTFNVLLQEQRRVVAVLLNE